MFCARGFEVESVVFIVDSFLVDCILQLLCKQGLPVDRVINEMNYSNF